MFKLIKIENSLTGVPEIVTRHITAGADAMCGYVYTEANFGLIDNQDITGPYYVCLENKKAESETDVVIAKFYKITSDMVFETKIAEFIEGKFFVGARLLLNWDENRIVSAYADEGGDFYVYDIASFEKDRIVRIKYNGKC